MQIPKDMVMSFVQSRLGGDQAAQADAQLPDHVDTEQHAGMLGDLGVDPQELLGHVAGGGGGGLAGEAEGLLGGSGGGGLASEAEGLIGGREDGPQGGEEL